MWMHMCISQEKKKGATMNGMCGRVSAVRGGARVCVRPSSNDKRPLPSTTAAVGRETGLQADGPTIVTPQTIGRGRAPSRPHLPRTRQTQRRWLGGGGGSGLLRFRRREHLN